MLQLKVCSHNVLSPVLHLKNISYIRVLRFITLNLLKAVFSVNGAFW